MFSSELMYASGRQHQRDKFNIISKKEFEKIEQPSSLETSGNHVIHIDHQMSQCGVVNGKP